jgi:uncharacterized repeat protein (TIGR03803 family)
VRAPGPAAAKGEYAVIARYTDLTAGQDPQAPLLAYGGALYGAIGGGKYNSGQAFELTRSGSGWSQKVLATFKGGAGGASPWYGMVRDAKGAFYGTTQQGGDPTCQCGAIYKLEPRGSHWRETAIYTFHGAQHHDGGSPLPLALDASGNLFGMTGYGGTGSCVVQSANTGCGYVYELSPSGKGTYTKTVLYNFQGGANDGAYPLAGLLAGPGGVFYGTTQGGGQSGLYCTQCGVAFELAPAGKGYVETVLYRFKGGRDGFAPTGALAFGDTPDTSSTLFGTTQAGGRGLGDCAPYTLGCGTVFSLNISGKTAKKTILHNFVGGKRDGAAPSGAVLAIGSTLYIATESGGSVGSIGLGTLSSVSVAGTNYTLIHSFLGGSDGDTPNAGLTLVNGSIFGTTLQGGKGTCGTYGCGTIFEYTP